MLNKYEYDQETRRPNEPDLVQYWPGTSKSGFVDAIFLEDKQTGGTLKVSVLPEPTEHDIEELDTPGASPKPSRAASPKSGNGVPVSVSSLAGDDGSASSSADEDANHEEHKAREFPSKRPKPERNGEKGNHGYREYKLSPHIEYSKLLVECNGQKHRLWHIRCGGWRDQDAPDLALFMDLWRLVQQKLRSHKLSHGEKYKIVIHCTGGVGRTGTFIAVDIAGQELKERAKSGQWEEFSIEKVISFLRQKRMNMVGSVSQYIFCHRAALNIFDSLHSPQDEKFVES